MIEEREKGKHLGIFPKDYTVLDIETTGLSSYHSEIIEIAALCIRKHEVVDEFQMLIKPYRPIPPAITQLTGISNADVENADTVEYVLPEFLYFAGNDIIVGHNVNFDIRFIADRAILMLGQQFNNDYVDTMILSRKYNKGVLSHHRLCDLAQYYGIKNENAHRALSDCYTTYQALEMMRKENE